MASASPGIRVFLSYTREDEGLALLVRAELADAGARVWIDYFNVDPRADRQQTDEVIGRALATSEMSVVCVSENFVRAQRDHERGTYAHVELRSALDAMTRSDPPQLVVLSLDKASVPQALDPYPRVNFFDRVERYDLMQYIAATAKEAISSRTVGLPLRRWVARLLVRPTGRERYESARFPTEGPGLPSRKRYLEVLQPLLLPVDDRPALSRDGLLNAVQARTRQATVLEEVGDWAALLALWRGLLAHPDFRPTLARWPTQPAPRSAVLSARASLLRACIFGGGATDDRHRIGIDCLLILGCCELRSCGPPYAIPGDVVEQAHRTLRNALEEGRDWMEREMIGPNGIQAAPKTVVALYVCISSRSAELADRLVRV